MKRGSWGGEGWREYACDERKIGIGVDNELREHLRE